MCPKKCCFAEKNWFNAEWKLPVCTVQGGVGMITIVPNRPLFLANRLFFWAHANFYLKAHNSLQRFSFIFVKFGLGNVFKVAKINTKMKTLHCFCKITFVCKVVHTIIFGSQPIWQKIRGNTDDNVR